MALLPHLTTLATLPAYPICPISSMEATAGMDAYAQHTHNLKQKLQRKADYMLMQA